MVNTTDNFGILKNNQWAEQSARKKNCQGLGRARSWKRGTQKIRGKRTASPPFLHAPQTLHTTFASGRCPIFIFPWPPVNQVYVSSVRYLINVFASTHPSDNAALMDLISTLHLKNLNISNTVLNECIRKVLIQKLTNLFTQESLRFTQKSLRNFLKNPCLYHCATLFHKGNETETNV